MRISNFILCYLLIGSSIHAMQNNKQTPVPRLNLPFLLPNDTTYLDVRQASASNTNPEREHAHLRQLEARRNELAKAYNKLQERRKEFELRKLKTKIMHAVPNGYVAIQKLPPILQKVFTEVGQV